MKKLLMIVMLFAIVLTGCETVTLEETLTPEEAPTNTPIPPTATPVPPTPTPLPPTATPLPPTATAIPDLNTVLVQAGFAPSTPLLEPGTTIGDLLVVTDSTSYNNSDTNEFVHTIVFPLPTAVEVAGFTLELSTPNYTILAIVGALQGVGIEAQVDLEGAVKVGSMSKGVTFTTNIGGTVMRVDVVLFMEGTNGAIVVVVRPDGAEPTVDAWTVAQKLDERIKGQ